MQLKLSAITNRTRNSTKITSFTRSTICISTLLCNFILSVLITEISCTGFGKTFQAKDQHYFINITGTKLLNVGTRSIWIRTKCGGGGMNESDSGEDRLSEMCRTNTSEEIKKVKLCAKSGSGGSLFVRNRSWKWEKIPRRYYYFSGSGRLQYDNETSADTADFDTTTMPNFTPTSYCHVVGLICDEYFDKEQEVWDTLTTAGVGIGILFSIPTLFFVLILLILAKQWRRQGLPGWITISSISTMFLLHIITGPLQVWSSSVISTNDAFPSSNCKFVGVIIHFLQLSTFSWLAVLSFDIWSTFRKINLKSQQSRNVVRLLIYAVFAYGFPGQVVTVGLVLDHFYGDNDCGFVITPRYGSSTCYLQPAALPFYLLYPTGFLIATNIGFFCSTAYNLKQLRESSSMSRENISKNTDQQALTLYWKLFFTMGIPWTCAVIAALFSFGALWTLSSFFQPMSIFVVFMCTNERRKTMRDSLRKLRSRSQSSSISMSTSISNEH